MSNFDVKSNAGIGQVLESTVSLLPIDKKIWAIHVRTVMFQATWNYARGNNDDQNDDSIE